MTWVVVICEGTPFKIPMLMAKRRKVMMITGAAGGVGKACVHRFRNRYDLITVDRQGDVKEKGDLRSRKFLKHLVASYEIDVLLNVAGLRNSDILDNYDVNFLAPTYLTLMFYDKMTEGHIINFSSTSANNSGWLAMPSDRIYYNTAKAALKKTTNVLQNSKNKRVKVTSFEPAQINTRLGGELVKIPEAEYRRQTLPLAKIKPDYIAEVIDWILRQPDPVVVATLELQNLIVRS